MNEITGPMEDTSTRAPGFPLERARVLVVDDDEMIGMIVHRVLKAHHVTAVTSAQDALAHIASGERFDAVLCDLMMPGMTGLEFHRILCEQYPDQASAVIFLTGGAFDNAAGAYLAAIPNAQLTKPFDAVTLRAQVDAHLAARRAMDGLS